ncbi:MAG: archaemetzincin [Candidatus Ozemobacteraceae bacterium]
MPFPKPEPDDWLAVFSEPDQTFDEYVRSKPNPLRPPRNRIYLLPIGAFSQETSPAVDLLMEYTSLFFMAETIVLPAEDLQVLSVTHRTNQNARKIQYRTGDLLDIFRKKLPSDGDCILGITMEDLYPDDAWNFVFGEATLKDKAGVFSFARYDPAFFGESRNADSTKLVLRRSCKVLAHETAHMFGLYHCVFFSCLINGSNHMKESDSRPMHECPVCLRKLQNTIGFDPVERYRKIMGFCEKVEFDDETAWLKLHLEKFLK